MHGISKHGAIDFGLPRGSKVLAPADGWAVCTFAEVQLTEKGKPRLISVENAMRHTPKGLLSIPDLPGNAWPAWYGSYVVQIWHGRGRYTQLAHVDWVKEDIPFFPPSISDNGDLIHNRVMRAPVAEIKRAGKFVKRGQVVAQVGMTGCGWGKRSYEFAEVAAGGRPDFRGADYWYWDQPHLHFMVFGTRRGKKRVPAHTWDPFGLYGDISAPYPQRRELWPTLPGSLWLGD